MSKKIIERIDYTFDDYKSDLKVIKEIVLNKNIKYDCILAPTRGGLTAGVALSHMLDLPLCLMECSFRDNNQDVKLLSDITGYKNILLVDDILDSGKTFEAILDHLVNTIPDVLVTFVPLLCSDQYIAEWIESRYAKYNENSISIHPARNFKHGTWIDFWWETINARIVESINPDFNINNTVDYMQESEYTFIQTIEIQEISKNHALNIIESKFENEHKESIIKGINDSYEFNLVIEEFQNEITGKLDYDLSLNYTKKDANNYAFTISNNALLMCSKNLKKVKKKYNKLLNLFRDENI